MVPLPPFALNVIVIVFLHIAYNVSDALMLYALPALYDTDVDVVAVPQPINVYPDFVKLGVGIVKLAVVFALYAYFVWADGVVPLPPFALNVIVIVFLHIAYKVSDALKLYVFPALYDADVAVDDVDQPRNEYPDFVGTVDGIVMLAVVSALYA